MEAVGLAVGLIALGPQLYRLSRECSAIIKQSPEIRDDLSYHGLKLHSAGALLDVTLHELNELKEQSSSSKLELLSIKRLHRTGALNWLNDLGVLLRRRSTRIRRKLRSIQGRFKVITVFRWRHSLRRPFEALQRDVDFVNTMLSLAVAVVRLDLIRQLYRGTSDPRIQSYLASDSKTASESLERHEQDAQNQLKLYEEARKASDEKPGKVDIHDFVELTSDIINDVKPLLKVAKKELNRPPVSESRSNSHAGSSTTPSTQHWSNMGSSVTSESRHAARGSSITPSSSTTSSSPPKPAWSPPRPPEPHESPRLRQPKQLQVPQSRITSHPPAALQSPSQSPRRPPESQPQPPKQPQVPQSRTISPPPAVLQSPSQLRPGLQFDLDAERGAKTVRVYRGKKGAWTDTTEHVRCHINRDFARNVIDLQQAQGLGLTVQLPSASAPRKIGIAGREGLESRALAGTTQCKLLYRRGSRYATTVQDFLVCEKLVQNMILGRPYLDVAEPEMGEEQSEGSSRADQEGSPRID